MGVTPQALAGLGIEGEDARIGAGHVDHAVMDDGLGFLAALFLVTEGERPGRGQLEYVVFIDLCQRTPALRTGAHAVLQDILGGQVIVGDVFPRSEEHTSELQSLMRISYAVFCLKKKTRNTHSLTNTHHCKSRRM